MQPKTGMQAPTGTRAKANFADRFINGIEWAAAIFVGVVALNIFVNVLLDKAIITSATFTALLLMASVSTMLTVPFAAPRLRSLRTDHAGVPADCVEGGD